MRLLRLAGRTVLVAGVSLSVVMVAACGEDEDPVDSDVPPAIDTVAGQSTQPGESPTAGTSDGTIEVDLDEQNGSGTVGLVALQPQGEQTRVDISLGGAGLEDDHPVHVHEGTCADLNPVPAFPLEDMERGRSTTTLDVPLDRLVDGNYVINVHKSEQEMDQYIACGAIER